MKKVINKKFVEMPMEELRLIDGGFAWVLIGLGAGCIGAFCMGVYNGYKENS